MNRIVTLCTMPGTQGICNDPHLRFVRKVLMPFRALVKLRSFTSSSGPTTKAAYYRLRRLHSSPTNIKVCFRCQTLVSSLPALICLSSVFLLATVFFIPIWMVVYFQLPLVLLLPDENPPPVQQLKFSSH